MTGLSHFLHLILHHLPITIAATVATIAIVFVLLDIWRKVRNRPDSYFIRSLNSAQRIALSQAGIAFDTTAVNSEAGVMFAAEDLKRVLKVLHAKVLSSHVLKGQEIHELLVRFVLPPSESLKNLTVQVSGYTPMASWRVKQVVRDVMTATLHKNIAVHACIDSHAPISDGAFHIFLYSTPGSWNNTLRVKAVWRVPVDGGLIAVKTSGLGVPFIDEQSNLFVAELQDDNNLYIHVDALDLQNREGRAWPSRAFRKIKLWGWDSNLGLLAHVLNNIRQDLSAQTYIDELIATLRAEGALTEEPLPTTLKITDTGFSGRRQEVLRSLAQHIILPAVKTDVSLVNGDGQARRARTDGNFTIFFNSSPRGTRCFEMPEFSWGYRHHSRVNLFAPSPLGVPIVNDGGYVIAELVGQNLYLTGELILYGTRSETALVARALLEARKAIEQKTTVDQAVTMQLGRECLRQREAAQAAQNTPPADALHRTRTDFTVALCATTTAQAEIFRIESAPTEELGHEYDSLLRIAKVRSVRVDQNNVVVSTDVLYCTDPRSMIVHRIGDFDIHIPVNGHGEIRWHNHSNSGMQMNAPHIDLQGKACLGSMKAVFPILIQRREFAGAIEAAIAFVESVNVSDTWGTKISMWPVHYPATPEETYL